MKSSARSTDAITNSILKVASPAFASLAKFAEGEIAKIGPNAAALSRSVTRTVAAGQKVAVQAIESLEDEDAIRISPAVERALLAAAYGTQKDPAIQAQLQGWLSDHRPSPPVAPGVLPVAKMKAARPAPMPKFKVDRAPQPLLTPEFKTSLVNAGVTAQRTIRRIDQESLGLRDDIRREVSHLAYKGKEFTADLGGNTAAHLGAVTFKTRDIIASLASRVRSVVTSDTIRKATLAAMQKFVVGAKIVSTDIRSLYTPSKVAMALVMGGALAGVVMAYGTSEAKADDRPLVQYMAESPTGFPDTFPEEFPDAFPDQFPAEFGAEATGTAIPPNTDAFDQDIAEEMAHWAPEYDPSLDQDPPATETTGLKGPNDWDYPINVTRPQLGFFGADQAQIEMPTDEFLGIALKAFALRMGDGEKAKEHLSNTISAFTGCFAYEERCKVETIGLSLDASHGVYSIIIRGDEAMGFKPRTIAQEYAGELTIVDQEALEYLENFSPESLSLR